MAYAPSSMHPWLRALSILILASILVAGSAEEPSHYRVELVHVDANGGFTRDELIRRAEHRTHLGGATLSATAPAPSSTTNFDTVYSDHEYLMELEIGTPPRRFLAVLDTGSSIVLLTKLNLCNTTSPSFTHMECSHSAEVTQGTMCTCCNGLRMFQTTYGGKRTVQGFMGKETLTFISSTTGDREGEPIPGVDINVGCTIHTHCDLVRDVHCPGFPMYAAGIVGLGRGPQSLVTQLGIRKFSYCLNDQLKPHLKSYLLLGDLTTTGGAAGHTTPLVNNEKNTKYYVQLCAISMGDLKIPVGGDEKSCNTDMLVDSGTSYTYLDGIVLEQVKKHIFLEVKNHIPSLSSMDTPMDCYPADELRGKIKTDLILEFAGNGVMRLPWNNYMTELNKKFCIAMKKHPENKFILGNFQQKSMKMLYDLENEKLSFEPSDCTITR